MTAQPGTIVYVVACAAPPARDLHELVALLIRESYDVHVVTTPTAAEWVDAHRIQNLTGNEVRSASRQLGEPRSYPKPDGLIVAPATFNTLNKWALGINDNAALGTLHDALGSGIPMIASPYAKTTLTTHPAFTNSRNLLDSLGVVFTETNALAPATSAPGSSWQVVLEPFLTRMS